MAKNVWIYILFGAYFGYIFLAVPLQKLAEKIFPADQQQITEIEQSEPEDKQDLKE